MNLESCKQGNMWEITCKKELLWELIVVDYLKKFYDNFII